MSEGVVSRRKFEFNPRVDVSHKFSKINSTISKLKGLISEK